jgi:imidazolonepropionase-like amidohydrolase
MVFTNFQLFDGTSSGLRGGLHLLIEGGRIKEVASGAPGSPESARLIDCGGHVLMPGLIDAHWHALLAGLTLTEMMTSDVDHVIGAASEQAERTLMRGFTTVRDLGGPSFPLKKAIDAGQTLARASIHAER